MANSHDNACPKARRSGLICETVGDEILIYDEANGQTVCLNASAAAVWRACDGKSTMSKIAAEQLGGGTGDASRILVQLETLGLLDGVSRGEKASGATPTSPARRTAFRRLAVGAGLATAAAAAPVITVMTAPAPAQAASLGGHGAPCTDHSQCASGTCDSFFNTCHGS